MNPTSSARPKAVWLCVLVAIIAIVVQAGLAALPLISAGDLSPLGYLLFWTPLILGLLGFWLMRWWGLVLIVVAGVCITCFSALGRTPLTEAMTLAIVAPTLITALIYRTQFK